MSEIEVPLEQVQESLQEHAVHSHGDRLMMRIALTSAFLAALAAVAALLAGHHSNEAMLEQLHASDQWGYYQAKGIKAAVLGTKHDLLKALGKSPSEKDVEKMAEYRAEQEDIKKEAEHKEAEAQSHLRQHVVLARSVTMFQVAIAIGAISALTRKRRFWLVSMAFGFMGIAFLLQGLLTH
ncbi:MAG: DUF4337 domain-containing protein [Deltaproteobacteria bacterium]|nr:DUF4337 domain-containing protein [Deltaproteobacteria bacterium]